MSRLLACLLFIFCIPGLLFADTGFEYKGDLNDDGIDDLIQSGPSSLFGNAGGPCIMSLSISSTDNKKGEIHCHPAGFWFEKGGTKWQPNRIWGYSRNGGSEGSLCNTSLDGKFTLQCITLYMTGMGSGTLKSVSENARLIKYKHIENYTPPETICGLQWGKGC